MQTHTRRTRVSDRRLCLHGSDCKNGFLFWPPLGGECGTAAGERTVWNLEAIWRFHRNLLFSEALLNTERPFYSHRVPSQNRRLWGRFPFHQIRLFSVARGLALARLW